MALDPSMPILVVDDYQTMVRIIRNLLKQLGFENVDDASDGSAAIAKMRDKKYGLVISDWNMEPMTGFELLQRVRRNPGWQHMAILMLIAKGREVEVTKGLALGANAYITKPFSTHELLAEVQRQLETERAG